MYAAVTKDDISRSGKTSLQDFLNSTKRSETKIAKAPGQREEAIVKKRSGGMSDLEKKDRLKKMLASVKGAAESFKSPGMRKQRLLDRYKERASMPRGVESEDFRILQEAKPESNRRMKDRSYMPNKNTYKRMSGAAMTDNEMRSMMDQISKPESMDRFKSGGSVMARGCKMGRKKPTKIY